MPARGDEKVVNPNTILDNNAILLERWRLLRLIPVINSEDKRRCLEWLCQRRLIKNSLACEICEHQCTLTRCQKGIDGYRWKCSTCNFMASVRSGSFFIKSKLSLTVLVLLIYYWAKQSPQKEVRKELDIACTHTTVDWYNFCRDVCETHLLENRERFGGGDIEFMWRSSFGKEDAFSAIVSNIATQYPL